jgi:hypothetical protein
MSELLKRNNWTKKTLKLTIKNRSGQLRAEYLEDISQFPAEQLIFIDESLFNETTG